MGVGRLRPLALCAMFAIVGCGGGAPTVTRGGGLGLEPIVQGLDTPVQAIALPGADTLLVLEQAGRVLHVEADGAPRVALDISARVASGGERGLLSLALHPTFEENRRVFLHFSDPDGNTRVEEHAMQGDTIDPAATRTLLQVEQPYSNHNGGSLAFGPDGRLYLGLGDGGSANDPQGNGQNPDSLLGKLLRLDVDTPDAEWEVAALGLRNPWRFSFDAKTGDAWIGDVGQNRWEEVDVLPAKAAGPLNFGWDAYEGREKVAADKASAVNPLGTLTPPVAVYGHDDGCSITGGVVYRGATVPALTDRYVYGDYCSGTVWSLPADSPTDEPRRESISVPNVVSFDLDRDGEVLVTSQTGGVRRITPQSP